jgi:hypothetical protein
LFLLEPLGQDFDANQNASGIEVKDDFRPIIGSHDVREPNGPRHLARAHARVRWQAKVRNISVVLGYLQFESRVGVFF